MKHFEQILDIALLVIAMVELFRNRYDRATFYLVLRMSNATR